MAQISICPQCDWVMRLPALARRETAHCPRCGYLAASSRRIHHRHSAACALAALLLLLLTPVFDFLSLDLGGGGTTITVPATIVTMLSHGYPLVATVLLLTTLVLPALWLLGVLYLSTCLLLQRRFAGAAGIAHSLHWLQSWMMADVFLIGALISLVKIVSLGEIGLGPAFYTFAGYALLLLVTLALFDARGFWARFGRREQNMPRVVAGREAAAQGLTPCHACARPFAFRVTRICGCCGHRHRLLALPRAQWTLALVTTAAMLLIPANLTPMLYSSSLGASTASTIIGGVRQLIEHGSWPIAAIIFVASIVIPIGKVLALGWLCWQTRRPRRRVPAGNRWLYRASLVIGRWSMIDVFVVAVASALVSVGPLAAVAPGPAALPFAAAVILTMIAAEIFDPRALWETERCDLAASHHA